MDLLPPIAAGDLDRYSMAEVVAAAFRANATGTISIEQGAGESRLFLRYGTPCGVTLFRGFQSLGEWLVDQGRLTSSEHERTLTIAAENGRKHGEVLVAEGLLTDAGLLSALLEFHRSKLHSLCLEREGRYELRGWERPPDWTAQLAFDPLRAVAWSFQQDELFDRRAAVLSSLGGANVRRAPDWESLSRQLDLDPLERRMLVALGVPRPVRELGQGLMEPLAAESFVAASLLLGLLEHDDGAQYVPPPRELTPAPRNARRAPPIDTQGLLSPAEVSSNPPDSLLRPIDTRPPPDFAPGPPRPLASAPPPPPYDANPYATAAAAFSDVAPAPLVMAPDPFAQLEAPLPGTHPDEPERHLGYGDVPSYDNALGPPGFGDDAPLELDLQRAPKEFARARLDALSQPAKKADTRAPAAKDTKRPESPPAEPAGDAARPPAARTRKPPLERAIDPSSPDYNPFAVQLLFAQGRGGDVPKPLPVSTTGSSGSFKAPPAAAPAPPNQPLPNAFVQVPPTTRPDPSISDLEDRLERALHDPTPLAMGDDEDAPPAEILGPAGTVPSPPLVPEPRTAPPPSSASILADIDELVREELGRPAHAEPPPAAPVARDDLALAAALESELGPDAGDEEIIRVADPTMPLGSFREDTARPGENPLEALVPPELLTDADGERPRAATGDQPKPLDKRGVDLRRRLFTKAIKTMTETVLSRPDSAPKPSDSTPAHTPPPQATSSTPVDEALAREVLDRVRRLKTDDHFTRLGVPRTADTEEIKTAFIAMAKRFHPDRMSGSGQLHLVDPVRELFAAIKESYDLISDPVSRERYRAELEAKEAAKSGGPVKRDPVLAKESFLKAQASLRRKALREAEGHLYRAVQLDPACEYLAELAWTLQSNPARREEAKDEIRDLLKQVQRAPVAHETGFRVLARFARLDGDKATARKYWRRVKETSPKDSEAAIELRQLGEDEPQPPPDTGSGGLGGLLKKFRKK